MQRFLGLLLSCVCVQSLTLDRQRRWSGNGGGRRGQCESSADCPVSDPVCSEWGFCQCACYKVGGADCWGRGIQICSGQGQDVGSRVQEQRGCSSNSDCPVSDPVCSEWGYCQCASYKPGDKECWGQNGAASKQTKSSDNKGAAKPYSINTSNVKSALQDTTGNDKPNYNLGPPPQPVIPDFLPPPPNVGGSEILNKKQGSCSSNSECPPSDPVCSEHGFCQCSCYQMGGPKCWGMGKLLCSEEKFSEGNSLKENSSEENSPEEINLEENSSEENGPEENSSEDYSSEKISYPNDHGQQENDTDVAIMNRASNPGGQVAQPGGQVAKPGGQVTQPGGQVAQPGGQGSCSSDQDCPTSNPVCSEYGYCQCSSYRPGDKDCWGQSQISKATGNGGTCSTDNDCPDSDPVCSEYGFCQCADYKPGDSECWSGLNTVIRTSSSNEPGSCSTSADCPSSDPVCSEHGFCQCENYSPGDADCWGASSRRTGSLEINCSADAECPSSNPVCSEWGYCQCSSYKPGQPECWGTV